MGSVYARGRVLWLNFKGSDGKWTQRSSRLSVGQQSEARKLLERIEAKIAAGAELGETDLGPVTVERFAKRWIEAQEGQNLGTAGDYESRLRNHALPVLVPMRLDEVRPRDIKKLIRSLVGKRAPRTIRHVYGTLHTMFAEAESDELIERSPCRLGRRDLPKKVDKDPTWRAGAVFTREETEALISDERIPEDRRTLYALLFLGGGMRFGEGAALRWRMYDATLKPLGRLLVAHSYNTHLKKVKAVKTEVPRQVPVHPTLARVLAAWKLGGWERMLGRPPTPDDLIVPSPKGKHRNGHVALQQFHRDLATLDLRKRRLHDLRRTFISLAQADGARKDILHWITHGPSGDIMDAYTTLPWETYCTEVEKLRIGLLEGRLIELPKAASAGIDGELATPLATVRKTPAVPDRYGGSARESNLLQAVHKNINRCLALHASSQLHWVPVVSPVAPSLTRILLLPTFGQRLGNGWATAPSGSGPDGAEGHHRV